MRRANGSRKLVASAAARGIQAVIYRPSQIIGHSGTGAGSVSDFVPSFLRGCLQAGCVPEFVGDRQLYLAPVDYVSRSIVAISKRQDVSGRVFNLTNSNATPLRELLDGLLAFGPALQVVRYEEWKLQVGADPANALARYLPSFAEHLPADVKPVNRPQYDCEHALRLAEAAGIARPHINQQLFQAYFSFLSEHAANPAGVAAQ
jgi:thioester reductase-like protein